MTRAPIPIPTPSNPTYVAPRASTRLPPPLVVVIHRPRASIPYAPEMLPIALGRIVISPFSLRGKQCMTRETHDSH